jgi:hypothetical protein
MDPVVVQKPGPTTGDDGDATDVGSGTIVIEGVGPTGVGRATSRTTAGLGGVSEPHAAVASINDTTTTGRRLLEMA